MIVLPHDGNVFFIIFLQIQKNHTLVGSDDPHGGKMFIPIPEATYLISACYEDMSSTFHYISPTGCVAIPSTSMGASKCNIVHARMPCYCTNSICNNACVSAHRWARALTTVDKTSLLVHLLSHSRIDTHTYLTHAHIHTHPHTPKHTAKPVQISASGDFVSTSVLPLTPNQQFVTLSPANVSPLSGVICSA